MLETGPEGRIYAGLKPGSTADDLRRAIADKTVADYLASFSPRLGDGFWCLPGRFTRWATWSFLKCRKTAT